MHKTWNYKGMIHKKWRKYKFYFPVPDGWYNIAEEFYKIHFVCLEEY